MHGEGYGPRAKSKIQRQLELSFERDYNRLRVYAIKRLQGVLGAERNSGHVSLANEVDDILQSMWLRILRRDCDWDPGLETALKYFVRSIDEVVKVERRKVNRRGKRARQVPEFVLIDGIEKSHFDATQQEIYDIVASIYLKDFLGFLTDKGPKMQRMAILLIEGEPKNRIAQILSISPSTELRMRAQLREHFEKYFDGVAER